MPHVTNVHRGFPASFEDLVSCNLWFTPSCVDLRVPPEVLRSLLWVSPVPFSQEGSLAGSCWRMGPSGGWAVAPVVVPFLLACLPHLVVHVFFSTVPDPWCDASCDCLHVSMGSDLLIPCIVILAHRGSRCLHGARWLYFWA